LDLSFEDIFWGPLFSHIYWNFIIRD
jgi:hypothetical protein